MTTRSEWNLTRIEHGFNEHQEKIVDNDDVYEGRVLAVWETKTYDIPLFSLLLLVVVIVGMRRINARRRAML